MKITRLTVGPLETNCYLAADEATGQAAIIDPGGDSDLILQTCRNHKLVPLFIVNTHAHADHIGANPDLKRAFPDAKLCIGRADAPLLTDSVRNLSIMLGRASRMPHADLLLDEGATLSVGSCRLRVIETPGHTRGAICLIADAEEPPVAFVGDLIFAGGVGRVDLPGGDWDALLASIRGKIFTLPDRTVLFPGHGPSSTVGEEKRSNPLS
jgi:hydroxyacylglutathione hydrolase